jgi:crotonobetainyl-CoA:carnitine CoA-transferase CaiB-like acyl-CoA transferase
MLECLAEWMMPPLYVWHGTGRAPGRSGVRHNMIVPYGAYACADGAVMFAVQHDREWRRFCAGVLEAPELADDPRFVTNALRVSHRDELEALIEHAFAESACAALRAKLTACDIPTGAVNDVPALAAHPQLLARGRWTTIDSPGGAIPALVPPHNLRGASPRMGAVPALGEHTQAVLAALRNEITRDIDDDRANE